MALQYFYGSQAEQFSFYRIPKALFTEERFRTVSIEAKLLYGLMLDRMELSARNGWLDEKGRVYIVYSIEEIMSAMGYARQKVAKLLGELEKDGGLIERRRLGLGRPNIIYVKNFIVPESGVQKYENHTSEPEGNAGQTGEAEGMPDSNFLKYENHTSGNLKIKRQEVPKSNANNTYLSDTEKSDTDQEENINSASIASLPVVSKTAGEEKRSDRPTQRILSQEERDHYHRLLTDNLRPAGLKKLYPEHRKKIDSFFELAYQTVCSSKSHIRIGGEELPAETVRQRLLSLNTEHLEQVLTAWEKNTTKVRNPRQYMLAMLYNAPVSMEGHKKPVEAPVPQTVDMDALRRAYNRI